MELATAHRSGGRPEAEGAGDLGAVVPAAEMVAVALTLAGAGPFTILLDGEFLAAFLSNLFET